MITHDVDDDNDTDDDDDQLSPPKAIKSLKKYPTVMESGRACAILESFGPKICKMLDDRLAEHRAWLAENEDVATGIDEAIRPVTASASSSSTVSGMSRTRSMRPLTSSSVLNSSVRDDRDVINDANTPKKSSGLVAKTVDYLFGW